MNRTTLSMAAAAVLAAAIPGAAQAQAGPVVRLGDTALTCGEIIIEADQLAHILGGAPEGGVFSSEQAISAATSFAAQGAILPALDAPSPASACWATPWAPRPGVTVNGAKPRPWSPASAGTI